MAKKGIILTGDRPTGPLHLGHFIGSLQNRVCMQKEYQQYIIIADMQALTDHSKTPEIVRKNVFEITLDYLACGINPEESTIFIQSLVPEIAELTMYLLNLVTVSRLERNPTVKDEMKQKGFGSNVPAGFLMYPVSQAADITAFGANLVPVGEDQVPVIEQTVEIVRSFNRTYGKVLVEPKPLLSRISRLPGLDGKTKMSKSLKNAIYLSDTNDEIAQKVKKMFTDPGHIRAADPGKIEGNSVFTYLDAFDPDIKGLAMLKENYQRGGVPDSETKKRLAETLINLIHPIRQKRMELSKDMGAIIHILQSGTMRAREKAALTLSKVRSAMKIDYF